jgi:hypothetical protein
MVGKVSERVLLREGKAVAILCWLLELMAVLD